MIDTGDLGHQVQSIINSYSKRGGICYTDGYHLPSLSTIRTILRQIEEILFPGYFETTVITPENLNDLIGEKIASVTELLVQEISKSLIWSAHEDQVIPNIDECKALAKSMTRAFFDFIPTLRHILIQDVIATYNGDPAAKSQAEIILSYPGFHATRIFRIAHFFYRLDVPLIPRMMTEIVHSQTGIDIHPGATIDHSFCIDHGTGIVIGETADIGNNVKLYQGVTLGALSIPKSKTVIKRHPTLGDHVIVYAETTILGGDTMIGSSSIIGGNVWITQSIPENSKIYLSSDYQQLIKSGRINRQST
jgi:serine O-acetyltransferase